MWQTTYSKLTAKEKDYYSLLIEGYSASEIAKQLSISIHRAKQLNSQILKKFKTTSKKLIVMHYKELLDLL